MCKVRSLALGECLVNTSTAVITAGILPLVPRSWRGTETLPLSLKVHIAPLHLVPGGSGGLVPALRSPCQGTGFLSGLLR